MKRCYKSLLGLLLAASLTGCGAKTEPEEVVTVEVMEEAAETEVEEELEVQEVVASDGYGVDGPQTVVVIYVAGLFIGLVRVKVDENTVESVCFRVIDAEMYHHV